MPIQGTLTVSETTITGGVTVDELVINGTLNISAGPVGPGVPAGGAIGQIISKSGADDYQTQWVDPEQASVPIEVTQHITRTDNPHNVTEAQIPDGIDYTLLFENALI